MEHTIEEMQANMTIIYNKRTGAIKASFSGIQNMDTLYGDEAEDYKLIWGELVLEKDEFVLNNLQQFKINTETIALELVQDIANKYAIASQ
jgi:hypothetical protein